MSFLQHPRHAVHDAANHESGDGGAEEGESQNGTDVAEEESLLHAVAGVEYDGREEHVEEDLGVERRLLVDLVEELLVLLQFM